jgi:hypothetical protein
MGTVYPRELIDAAVGFLYGSPGDSHGRRYKDVFRINAARDLGDRALVLIDAAWDLDGTWEVSRVMFGKDEPEFSRGRLRERDVDPVVALVKGRIDAAIDAMESKGKSAGRPFVPLSLLTGSVTGKATI